MNDAHPQAQPQPPWLLPIPSPLSEHVLRAVYASDQAMYPVALSYARLRAWVVASPALSVSFTIRDTATATATATDTDADTDVVGVIIVLPLRKVYWEQLLSGGVKEVDVDPGSMFPGVGMRACGEGFQGVDEGEVVREEVGLHVYHVEKFATEDGSRGGDAMGWGVEKKRFAEFALDEVMRRVEGRREWKVVGLSGLCPSTFSF